MKGDKNCVVCGAWLGNYITGETPTGQASYYSIIRRKYCPECRTWKRSLDFRFYCAEYHKRKKQKDKERDKQYELLKAENKALRQMVADLREQLREATLKK